MAGAAAAGLPKLELLTAPGSRPARRLTDSDLVPARATWPVRCAHATECTVSNSSYPAAPGPGPLASPLPERQRLPAAGQLSALLEAGRRFLRTLARAVPAGPQDY